MHEDTPEAPSQQPENTPASGKRVVYISFRPAGKRYLFAAGDHELEPGTLVIVETNKGHALGRVVTSPKLMAHQDLPPELKPILHPATEEDLEKARLQRQRQPEAMRICHECIKKHNLPMKLVKGEYIFDGSKIIFYFTADGRVDFRELVRDLAHQLHTRIEMRQIGVRDEAKIVGGMGVCGRELCCCSFLCEFQPVSVKMAKEQGLALSPGKISGQCGRLLCCLAYEYETYQQLRETMPAVGNRVQWHGQPAEVTACNLLQQTVTLKLADNHHRDVPVSDLGEKKTQPTPEAETPAAAQPQETAPATAAEKAASEPARTKAQDPPKEGAKQQPAGGKEDGSPGPRKSRGRRRRPSRGGQKRQESKGGEQTAKADGNQPARDKPKRQGPEKSDSAPGKEGQQRSGSGKKNAASRRRKRPQQQRRDSGKNDKS